MTPGDEALNRLLPAFVWRSDWTDVLRRSGALDQRKLPPSTRRRLILALAALAAILIPLIALGLVNDSWLFG